MQKNKPNQQQQKQTEENSTKHGENRRWYQKPQERAPFLHEFESSKKQPLNWVKKFCWDIDEVKFKWVAKQMEMVKLQHKIGVYQLVAGSVCERKDRNWQQAEQGLQG